MTDLVGFCKGLDQVINVVIMFIFAIIFFGIMNDSSGLFKPLVKRLILMTRQCHYCLCNDTLIGTIAQLDGAGAVTFCLLYSCLITFI